MWQRAEDLFRVGDHLADDLESLEADAERSA
jgi:hypothetical protein